MVALTCASICTGSFCPICRGCTHTHTHKLQIWFGLKLGIQQCVSVSACMQSVCRKLQNYDTITRITESTNYTFAFSSVCFGQLSQECKFMHGKEMGGKSSANTLMDSKLYASSFFPIFSFLFFTFFLIALVWWRIRVLGVGNTDNSLVRVETLLKMRDRKLLY